MSKMHKIFYQPTDVLEPYALELHVYYSLPKIYEVEGAIYHSALPNKVKTFILTNTLDYLRTFNSVWEILSACAEKSGFEVNRGDYELLISDFCRELEKNNV